MGKIFMQKKQAKIVTILDKTHKYNQNFKMLAFNYFLELQI